MTFRALPALLLLCVLGTPPAFGQSQKIRIVSGASLVQFSHPENLKLGRWVEYRIRSDGQGVHGEATQKVSFTGYDTWHGERCLWIETEYTENNQATQYCRVLLSNKIVRDPHGGEVDQIHKYARKIQTMQGRRGGVQELIFPKLAIIDSTNSRPLGTKNQVEKRDTLETTEVTTAAGKFQVTPTIWTRTVSFVIPISKGRGSKYHYQSEVQTSYRSAGVPLTQLASQTTLSKYLDANIPVGGTVEDATRTMVMPLTRKEVEVTRFGLGAVSVFPKHGKTTQLGAPKEGEIEPTPTVH